MTRSVFDRRGWGHASAAMAVLSVAAAALVACGDSGDSSGAGQALSPTPTTADTAGATPTPTLPPEPLVLYEWYPDGEEMKSIIVSDEQLSAPPVRVVPDGTGAAIHSSWSHDGSQFTWEVLAGETASAWTANADGSDPVERAACEADPCVQMAWPAFSPDDSQLLVVQYDIASGGDWGASHLVTVDLETGAQTTLASTDDGTTAFYLPSWSPDGSKVAVQLESYPDAAEERIDKSVIVVVDTDPSTTAAPMAVTKPSLFAGYPRWHPSDDRILFASWDLHAFHGAEKSQLYTVASDGSGLKQLTQVDYKGTSRRPGEATWTPDGTQIIASVGAVNSGTVTDVKISWIDPKTGQITETMVSGAMATLQP